jgi:uncharacterized protein (DUF1800 family)
VRNAKANPSAGTTPDENFAREIMQLFSIGLWQLQPDGQRIVPNAASYTQQDITEMAKVWTGWSFAGAHSWWDYPDNSLPMTPWSAYHEQGAKTILGQLFVANQGAYLDVDQAINLLTFHPNCAPFISRQLIQRLTVSQPTAQYVKRVADVWRDTGGNLGEVVKAILLDADALVPDTKMREPLLMQAALWRALGTTSTSGNYYFDYPEMVFSQAPLRASSVFNFFRPEGEPAPEFEILSHVTVMNMVNNWYRCMQEPADIQTDQSLLISLATSPSMLVEYLNLALRQGNLQPGERALIEQHLAQIPSATTRARDAVYLILSSPHAFAS